MTVSVELGRRIKELREGAGLSQSRLADAARIHRTHLGALERGERSCTVEVLSRIASALAVVPGELYPQTRGVSPNPAERLGAAVALLAKCADEETIDRFAEIAKVYFTKGEPRKGRRRRTR